jgi:hypothetical protein
MEIELEADLEDRLSLAAFAELWWADLRPQVVDLKQFLDNKQAALRMLRRNHPGFPAPVTASSRTHLYRLGDLANWVEDAQPSASNPGEAVQERSALVGVEWHLDRAIDACIAEVGPGAARRLALLIVIALDHAGLAPGLSRLPARVKALIEKSSGLSELLRSATSRRAAPPPGLAEAIDVLVEGLPDPVTSTGRLARTIAASLLEGEAAADIADHALDRSESQLSTALQRRTGDSLTMLILAAGRPRPGERIVDLAAGEAGLLIRAAVQAGDAVRLAGIEVDRAAWAIGRCRLHLHRRDADFRLGDSLGDHEPLPAGDLVLVDPPVDKRRDYVRWLAAATRACGEGGRAVVALPALTAEPGRREWKDFGIRHCTFLVKGPARLRLDRGVTLAIWGVREKPSDDMLLVDASRLGLRRVGLSEIGEEQAEELGALLDQWEQSGRVEALSWLPAAAFPRAAYGGLPDEFNELGRRAHGPDSDIGAAMKEALALATRLDSHLNGELQSYAAEQHRRAIHGLTQRLTAQLQLWDTGNEDP